MQHRKLRVTANVEPRRDLFQVEKLSDCSSKSCWVLESRIIVARDCGSAESNSALPTTYSFTAVATKQ